ncbi:MAG TPA: hypothetical protein VGD17_08400 [Chitinophagaceae bacterium]
MPNQSNIEKLNSPGLFTRFENTSKGRCVRASPLEYDELMRIVPPGKLITVNQIEEALVKKFKADYACPRTSAAFIQLVALASEERVVLGSRNITPWWRTLKGNGELNGQFPGGADAQKMLLEIEGHKTIQQGRKYLIKDWRDKLHSL